MRQYLIRRLLMVIPTLILVSFMVFLSLRLLPGNMIDIMIAEMGGSGTTITADRDALLHALGLDMPIHIQYGRWLWGIFQGDFGSSLLTHRPAIESIMERLPVSIELGTLAIILTMVLSLPLGIWSAIRQDTISDYVGRSISIALIAIPGFWIGTMIMVYPSIWWNWSPSIEYVSFFEDPIENLKMFILPAFIIGMTSAGGMMRWIRTMMLETLRQDYIRTAWSKGLKERVVIFRHALKNSLIPVITIFGYQIPLLVGGSVIIEQIFSLPGIGRLMLDSLIKRDYTIVAAINMFIALVVLSTNIIVDVAYGWLDPRVKFR
jgi:peptide/nickel transport system permease protein